ncbi:hypothetical protein GGR58DRAFT_501107 [Xylaria digitata]|nr:hypothetical protein GGR58DRAFT_501107 [Xylaria digitata]
MDSASTTTVTGSMMGAKLLGLQENESRPIQMMERLESGEISTVRIGDSRPTRCLFLADDGSLKWVAVNAGVFPGWWYLKNTSHLVFPPFPTGSWNVGQIHRAENGKVCFKEIAEIPLEGIENAWHPTKIDFTEFELIGTSTDGRLWHAKHPRFNGRSVFVKIDWAGTFSKQVTENETRAYQRIDGRGIAPEFLGHVTYHGAIIGFILEWLEGARTTGKRDESDRIDAVKRLHALGITHGSAHHLNFLKRGKDMLMIDFEESRFDDQATDKRKKKDIKCICDYRDDTSTSGSDYDYDEDFGDDSSISSDDDEDYPTPPVSNFFDWMVDDEINWTDDSEAGPSDEED